MKLIFFIKYHNHFNFFKSFDVEFFRCLRTTILNYKEQTMLLPFKSMPLEKQNHLKFLPIQLFLSLDL